MIVFCCLFLHFSYILRNLIRSPTTRILDFLSSFRNCDAFMCFRLAHVWSGQIKQILRPRKDFPSIFSAKIYLLIAKGCSQENYCSRQLQDFSEE